MQNILLSYKGQKGIKISKCEILSYSFDNVEIKHAALAPARPYKNCFALLSTSFSDTVEVQSSLHLLLLIFV
jgi:hypothetical protein